MKYSPLPLAALAAALLTTPALAQLTIVNPGFESPDVGTSFTRYSDGAFPGWTAVAGSDTTLIFLISEDATGVPNASSGTQSLALGTIVGSDQGLYQSIGTLQANTDYSFSYEVGYRSNTNNPNYQIGLWGDTTGNGLPDTALHVRTQADDGTIAEGDVPMTQISSTIVNSSTFNANAIGNDLFFRIFADDGTTATGSEQVVFDNVAAIPEPSTTAALLGGLALTLVLLRRRY